METKKRSLVAVRGFALLLGLSFAFVSGWWKIGILAIALLVRTADADTGGKWMNATVLFFIGVIVSYLFVLTGLPEFFRR
jgi:hypothetical protein